MDNLVDIKSYLIERDPKLQIVFDEVGELDLTCIRKEPYTSLLGAIIGQKIRYQQAKQLRGKLYSIFGTDIKPETVKANYHQLSFLSDLQRSIIIRITDYIIANNLSLETEDQILSLKAVPGVGPWTIQTTLLTSMLNIDIFPTGDKFLEARIKKLYGNKHNNVMNNWVPYRSIVAWYLWRWF